MSKKKDEFQIGMIYSVKEASYVWQDSGPRADGNSEEFVIASPDECVTIVDDEGISFVKVMTSNCVIGEILRCNLIKVT